MDIIIRGVRAEDRAQILEVERKSTPGLVYLPHVFEQFLNDAEGEFLAGEVDGTLAGCAKFTRLPDGSAWLETLRVIPERQGLGVGKQFYQRFFEIARSRQITTMRMYTGVTNHTSKGLAERFGFLVAGTYRGQKCALSTASIPIAPSAFQPARDPDLAVELLLAQREAWAGFVVMNRTFYAITPALGGYLARHALLYHDPGSGSMVVLGARFMPWQALHIAALAGDVDACLAFAAQQAAQTGAGSLSCLSPVTAGQVHSALQARGFAFEPSDFIVMQVNIP